MWTDSTMIAIGDADPYTDADGVQHLGQRDKSTIPGLMRVAETPRPDETPTGYTVDGAARGGVVVVLGDDGREYRLKMIDGVPTQVWHTAPRPEMSEAEALAVAWVVLRAERDRLLAASDILVLPDRWAAMTDDQRAAWTVYRQALRDLPDVTTDPVTPDWPEVPG